jgi:hypothetical protein
MKTTTVKSVIAERGVLDGLIWLLDEEEKSLCKEYSAAAKACGGALPETAFYTLDQNGAAWAKLTLHDDWKFDVGVYDADDDYDTSGERSLVVYVGGKYFAQVDLRRISDQDTARVSEIIGRYMSIRLDYFQSPDRPLVCSDFELERKFREWGFDCSFSGGCDQLYECLSREWNGA